MNQQLKVVTVTVAVLGSLLSGYALAALSEADAKRLDTDLTPTGATRAGNADNTIPEWKGGLKAPPAGWKPEQGYTDPFVNEKPLFTITGANADQYKDKLSPGLLALLKKYPDFRMPVYPSHRTAALPDTAYFMIRAEGPKIEMKEGRITGRVYSPVPFPVPRTGDEAMQNHILRHVGGSYEREGNWLAVLFNGEVFKGGRFDHVVTAASFTPPQGGNLGGALLGRFTGPAILEGTTLLVHEPIDQVTEQRSAWVYNAGQRRVRRAPDVGYDNFADGTLGLRTNDQFQAFNGATDRYNWKLVGKKEMYVPYNTYKIGDKKLKYKNMVDTHTIRSDLMRYELHRVWVVEATQKDGMRHVYGKRTFYLDEDSWMVLGEDVYDTRGSLWRVGVHGLRQNYDALVPWYGVQIWHDVTNQGYLADGLDNEIKAPIVFGKKAKWADFQPERLDGKGIAGDADSGKARLKVSSNDRTP
ncbi:MAG: DUF1329 domain-containing protein [Dechloromonas sp.]|nr:DUF1329 domain-containing protein [Dechloromonas sp.]